MMKQSKLYGFVTILGIALVALFFAFVYWRNTGYIYHVIEWNVPYPTFGYLMLLLAVGGTVFLIAGILGIGIKRFETHKTLFTLFIVISVPLFIYGLFRLLVFLTPLPFSPE
jgi:hypothetical protein